MQHSTRYMYTNIEQHSRGYAAPTCAGPAAAPNNDTDGQVDVTATITTPSVHLHTNGGAAGEACQQEISAPWIDVTLFR